MPKKQKYEISVVSVFDGKKDARQAFIELILNRHYVNNFQRTSIDKPLNDKYNRDKVFFDERVE